MCRRATPLPAPVPGSPTLCTEPVVWVPWPLSTSVAPSSVIVLKQLSVTPGKFWIAVMRVVGMLR